MSKIRYGLLVMTFLVFAFSIACADIVPIPLDQLIMEEPDEKYYVSDREYEDPSIHVVIEEGTYLETRYLVARIQIQDPSQIRSYMTGGKKLGGSATYGQKISKKIHPVLAISGDLVSLGESKAGKHIVRLGKTLLSRANGTVDCLIIDDQGDMTILTRATEDDIAAFEGTIISSYGFGPAIVVDGVQMTDFSYRNNVYGGNKNAQRICIGQTGKLSYIAVVTAGPDQKNLDGSKCRGLTISEFSDLVYAQGDVINAYNLDGGSSSYMLFRDEKINAFGNKSLRAINDVIYFASAYHE